ncbi:MAG: Gfo/Idh/MocA family protein, partial [Planctomycetota bacterium]
GTGAAINAANADSNVKITALADAFADRIQISREGLAGQLGERLAVTDDTCFDGFDCADKLIATDVDVVLLCQPPHFRPDSLRAAIKAGKHVFCEKPVAVDVPGAMSVLETCQNAGDRNIVSGLCWRYDLAVREVMNRIQEGEIGRIVNIQETYLQRTVAPRSQSEVERNGVPDAKLALLCLALR